MKATLLFLILTLIVLQSSAQITFEKGYFIDNNNNRVECLIKNNDWKENPKEFEYKLTENADAEKGSTNTVKEFGVIGYSKYVKADTKIDLSSMQAVNLSKDRNPEWSQEKLFLKVLVEGKATLYYFERNGLIRFFYSVPDSAIKQLIYKEFISENENISENFTFRGQLWNDVKCSTTAMNDVESLNYRINDLERYFRKYNDCTGSLSIDYNKKEKKDLFNLRITPALNYASLSEISGGLSNINFGSQINYSIGLEMEIILPFNKNKWGILFEPTYQYFKAETPHDTYIAVADYKSIECLLGLRHYFFLSQNLKLFLNFQYIPGFSYDFNSTIYKKEIESSSSIAFGGGVGYKKISTEMRYYVNRNLLNNYNSISTDYHRISLIIGFKIL